MMSIYDKKSLLLCVSSSDQHRTAWQVLQQVFWEAAKLKDSWENGHRELNCSCLASAFPGLSPSDFLCSEPSVFPILKSKFMKSECKLKVVKQYRQGHKK